MNTKEKRDAQDARSMVGFADRVQATHERQLALVEETKNKFFNETLELKAEVKRLTEAYGAKVDHCSELLNEIDRLTKALNASNADRDRLAQQLGMAQTEARGLRIELQRLSAPTGDVA